MRSIDASLVSVGEVDAGPPPMLDWIEIDKLRVDDRYQRDLLSANVRSIGKIAMNFRWSKFSTVFVAPIEGGLFAIIDGQHRCHAAAACGFKQVPCQIVQMSLAEQAASFAAVNGIVVKVTVHQIFKAALAAGEEWALECDRSAKAAECRVMSSNVDSIDRKPGEIYTIGLMRTLIEAGKADMVTLGLRTLRRSTFGSEATAWSNDVLRPWLFGVAERPWLAQREDELLRTLESMDFYQILDQAAEEVKNERRQGGSNLTRWQIVGSRVAQIIDKTMFVGIHPVAA